MKPLLFDTKCESRKKIKKPWWNIIPECHTLTLIPLSITKIQVLTRSIRLSWILFSVVRNLLLLRPSPVDSNWKKYILLQLRKEISLKLCSKTWAYKDYLQLTYIKILAQNHNHTKWKENQKRSQHPTLHWCEEWPTYPSWRWQCIIHASKKSSIFYCYNSVFDCKTLDFLVWVMSSEWCPTTPPPSLAFTPHPSQMVFTPLSSYKISCNYQMYISFTYVKIITTDHYIQSLLLNAYKDEPPKCAIFMFMAQECMGQMLSLDI